MFQIRVVPGSRKQSITLDKAKRLTCYLQAHAEKGAANKELVRMLAKQLGLAQADVTIIAGQTGRIKYMKLSITLTHDELLARLGIEKQLSLV